MSYYAILCEKNAVFFCQGTGLGTNSGSDRMPQNQTRNSNGVELVTPFREVSIVGDERQLNHLTDNKNEQIGTLKITETNKGERNKRAQPYRRLNSYFRGILLRILFFVGKIRLFNVFIVVKNMDLKAFSQPPALD